MELVFQPFSELRIAILYCGRRTRLARQLLVWCNVGHLCFPNLRGLNALRPGPYFFTLL